MHGTNIGFRRSRTMELIVNPYGLSMRDVLKRYG